MKIKKIILLFVIFLLFTGCSQAETKTISLVNWNVQTFFDAETEGTEYKEFTGGGKWSKDKYQTRLNRLCEVMCTLNADIFVFEEIENSGIIYDISNNLAGKSWDQKNNWNYACFAKEENAAIGCAVFSKYPLKDQKIHSFDVRTQKDKQPSARPVLQVTAEVNGNELIVFVSHWKSKSGGEEESEIWRDWQESVLANCVLSSGAKRAVLCGDFNRDAPDFVVKFSGNEKAPNTILRGAGGEGVKILKVYNPWFKADGKYICETGSYYFDEKWERIDQIFCYGDVEITSFIPRAEEPWANEKNIPIGYKVFTGEGYSDHLPVMCNLIIK